MDIKSLFLFRGRAKRTEWWGVGICAAILYYSLDSISDSESSWIIRFMIIILYLLMAWVAIATNTRRCHDLGHSGFWQLIPFYAIWLGFVKGTPGENEYGPDPFEALEG